MNDLSQYNLMEDSTRECPFPYLRSIRQQQPIYFMPELGAYYISRYQDVRYVKKHPELFSNNIYEMGARRGSQRDMAEEYRAKHGWKRVSTLQRTDPPVHTRYRSLIDGAFNVKRVRTMTSYIEKIVNELIDAIIAGQETGTEVACDFVSAFATPLPCTVIADQLGVPRTRIVDLKKWSDAMLAPGGGFVDSDKAVECAKLVVQAQKFFAAVMDERRQHPRDDIITDLVHAKIKDAGEDRPLSMFELQDLLDQLLTGGNETTTSALGSALAILIDNPSVMNDLKAHPELMRNFIEEALRFDTPVLHLWRVATQDTQINGVAIPKGASLALGYASANRDEDVFPDSERFDIQRNKPGAHLAFGSGPHHCPGAALARQEMFSAFTILLNRLDNIELQDPTQPLKHVPSSFLRGLSSLRIRFRVANTEHHLPGASVF